MPSCTVAEVPGTIWSGVVVARITPSISSGRRPALASAAIPASMASCEVVPPIRRSRMPVRSWIQASLVSMVTDRSSLVTTLSGTAMPQPVMMPPRAGIMVGVRRSWVSPPRARGFR